MEYTRAYPPSRPRLILFSTASIGHQEPHHRTRSAQHHSFCNSITVLPALKPCARECCLSVLLVKKEGDGMIKKE
eukprot:scaffold426_cov219-Amphora_coffeaeformis.AAC.20